MIGKHQIKIDATQFSKGQAVTDYSPEAGFGASSKGLNPRITPGIIYATAAAVDASANVAGNFVASCEDGQSVASYDRLFVDDAANYYTLASGALTKQHTGAKTYTFGTSDMTSFAGYSWITSTTDMARWNTSGPTLIESWWVTTSGKGALSSGNRHPLLVFEQLLWLADGNQLYFIDTALTITTAAWTLPSNELIVATGIDPYTGMMLVSVVTLQNYSSSKNGKSFVYLYDGYSSKPRRKIPVDDMVTAFYNVGGTVYVGYGQRVGMWNGNGVSFLRPLMNVTLAGADLPYKHHFSNIGNVLYVVDGTAIMAFGEIIPGTNKAWWNAHQNQSSATKLNLIANVGSNKVGISVATNIFKTVDMSAAGSATANFYATVNIFERPTNLRWMRVITTGITTTAGVGLVKIVDENGTVNKTSDPGNPNSNFVVASGTKYVFDFPFNVRCQIAQPLIAIDTQAFGIISIILYYDAAE